MGLMPSWLYYRVALATQRNTYTGPSLLAFHIWYNDVMLCAKPKVYATVAGKGQGFCVLGSLTEAVLGRQSRSTATILEA